MLNTFDQELERLDGIETDFLRILYYDLPKNFSGTYQSHAYTRFCTILKGEKHIAIKDRAFTYDKSQFLLLPAHTEVQMDIDQPTRAMVFELNDALFDQVIRQSQLGSSTTFTQQALKDVFLQSNDMQLFDAIQHITEMTVQNGQSEHFLLDLYAQKLVYHLLRIKPIGDQILSGTGNPMQRAIDYMSVHLNEPITIHSIAKKLQMSESNFSHAFKKQMGLTPQKYLHQLKMKKAVELLKSVNVTEAALDLGYENPSHFIRLFKDAYGLTPKQYQKFHG